MWALSTAAPAVGAVSLNITQPIQAAAGTIRLRTTAAAPTAIAQTAAGDVLGAALGIQVAGGNVLLTGDDNDVDTLAGAGATALSFIDDDGFSIATVTAGTTGCGYATVSGIVASGAINLTATDNPGPGDDITVAGVTVQSTGASVTLNAGDNVDIPSGSAIQAGTNILINVDGSAGTDADVNLLTGGSTVTLRGAASVGNVALHALTINGGDDYDTFTVKPQTGTPINVDGRPPEAPTLPGDVLNLDLSALLPPTPPTLEVGDEPGEGSVPFPWWFNDATPPQRVYYRSIEQVNATDDYHLKVTTGGNIIVERDAAVTGDVEILIDNSEFFQGSLLHVLSLQVYGTAASQSLTVRDANAGFPVFKGVLPNPLNDGASADGRAGQSAGGREAEPAVRGRRRDRSPDLRGHGSPIRT